MWGRVVSTDLLSSLLLVGLLCRPDPSICPRSHPRPPRGASLPVSSSLPRPFCIFVSSSSFLSAWRLNSLTSEKGKKTQTFFLCFVFCSEGTPCFLFALGPSPGKLPEPSVSSCFLSAKPPHSGLCSAESGFHVCLKRAGCQMQWMLFGSHGV